MRLTTTKLQDSMSAEIGILDTIDVPIVVVASDCTVSRFNRAAIEVLGLKSSDIGRLAWDVQALMGVNDLKKTCSQVIADGFPCRADLQNGDRWFFLRIAPLTGSDSQIRGAMLTFTNVTAFRETLGRAVYEREYTKAILNTTTEALVVLNAEMLVQTANRAFHALFDLSREEAQGVSLRDLGNGDWRNSDIWPSLKATLVENHEFQTVQVDCNFPAGRRTVLLEARRLSRDADPLVLLAFRDITALKQTEEALRESEVRFRNLFDSMDEGYCVIEVIFNDQANPIDYRILEVNPAFEKQTGIKNAQGRLMREIAPNIEQHWFDLYGRIALTGETLRFENPAAALGRHYDVCAFRIEPPEFRRVGVVFSDITERKRLEAERERLMMLEREARTAAELANQVKDEFLAMVSHELRTPLNAIVGWMQLLKSGKLDQCQAERAIEIIDRNAKAQSTIINELLDTSRIISGKLQLDKQPTDLAGVIKAAIDVVRPAAEGKAIEIVTAMEPKSVVIAGDGVRLQQVVWNLLTNAVKFTSERGRIEVQLKRIGTDAVIVVSDTGAGIHPEFLPYIFERFQQANTSARRSHDGLGLGLSIVRNLVEMHGGRVIAESEGEGRGTKFIVTLSGLAESDINKARSGFKLGDFEFSGKERCDEEDLKSDILSGLRVLAVDDQPDSRALIILALTRYGAEVRDCASVIEALNTMQQWKPEVIVSDIGMPDEDGYDLIQKIRAFELEGEARIPAVALTGYAGTENESKARAAGYEVHLTKPVELLELAKTIARLSGRL